MGFSGGRVAMFEYQAPATLNQAAPVQNTWYILLDTTANCRVYAAAVNVEDADETLELRATVDGQIYVAEARVATHSTTYHAHKSLNAIARVAAIGLNSGLTTEGLTFLVEGHSVKVELRKTTAAGAGNLTGIVVYGVLTDA